jgi:GNAT superfamily N-acetyltransferase
MSAVAKSQSVPVPKFVLEEIETSPQFEDAFPVLLQLLAAENPQDPMPLEEDVALGQYLAARKQGYRLFAAKGSSEVLGVAGLRVLHDPLNSGRPYAIINNLVVEEDYRGLGIGQEMLARLEKMAKAEKCGEIIINALKTNRAAKKFYEGRAYTPVADVFVKDL